MKLEPSKVRRVLCALDVERSGSASLSMASLLAEQFQASVDALYATPALPMFDGRDARVERVIREHNAQERLDGMLAAVKRKIEISSFVTRGEAATVILSHSERASTDLIVMASSRRRCFAGGPSTIAPVTARAACAVLTVGDRFQPVAPRRILLPVGSVGAEPGALSWVSSLASRFDAEVGVLRICQRRSGVWKTFSDAFEPAPQARSGAHVDRAQVLAVLCSRGIDAYEIEHPGGDDSEVVSDLCESGGFDAVVMGLPPAGQSGDVGTCVAAVRMKTSALVLSVRTLGSPVLFAPSHWQALPKAVVGAVWAQP